MKLKRIASATSAGSDGIRLMKTKHTKEIIRRSGIAERIRLMIYGFKTVPPVKNQKTHEQQQYKAASWETASYTFQVVLFLRT